MKIYLGGSFQSQKRLRPMRDQLFHMGHEVVSTWLDEVQKPENMSQIIFNKKLAIKDLTEVKMADCIIMDTNDPSTTGGRNVEWGFALAHAKLMYVVGPSKSIFEQLADGIFEGWEDLFKHFEKNHPTKEYVATGMEGKKFTNPQVAIAFKGSK